MVMVAGISDGKMILKMQLASSGKLTLNPTFKLLISFTVVNESALSNVASKRLANSVA